MSVEIPDWYVLKDPGEITIDTVKWYDYANLRLERFLSEDMWIINKPTWMTEKEWFNSKVEEIGGHFLLRLAVAKDPRLTSWLVEVEGDLFEFRFVSSPDFEQKIQVLMDLYGTENVTTIDDINRRYKIDLYRKYNLVDIKDDSRYLRSKFGTRVRDLDKRIAIKYYKIPSVISSKRALLLDGWAIIKLADIRLAVKREFEKQLQEVIEETKTLIEQDSSLNATVKPITDRIDEVAKSSRYSRDFSKLGFDEGEAIFTKPDIFPPCIQELLSVLQSRGHLSHVENWQLGTFLKRAGMTIDEQYKFWYHNSVDNVGTSFDEFVGKVGYQIRHIYGQAGGGIDYDPPNCKTCIDGYFCFWAHKRLEDINEIINTKFEKTKKEIVDNAIDEISKLVINQRFQFACARYFELLTGWKTKGSINHMLYYAQRAYRRIYKNKVSSLEENKEGEL